MKNSFLFLSIFSLFVAFFSTSYAKIFFITLPSLQQTEILSHKNHCSYYATHAASTALEYFNTCVSSVQSERIEALQALECSRDLFTPRLVDWEPLIFASRKSGCLETPAVDFVGTHEIINVLVSNDPSLYSLYGRGQIAFIDVSKLVCFCPWTQSLKKAL